MDDHIGPYRLERQLGSGGMGVVHLARDAAGKRVAIKVMHAQWSAQPEYRERFRDEAEAARRVARFCTAAVLDASFGEPTYMVTEYIEGRTLAAAVEVDGVLDGGDLESVAVGTAVALSAIHRAGIVHRDLKPGNIILSPYGPKVIDFGIAQLEEVEGRTGPLLIGTPTIIAPERLTGQRAGPPADVFSWGCVVAYAGTGRWPFGAGNTAAIYHRIMNEPPRLDGLDERLRPLVEAALTKDSAARPTISHLLQEMTGQGLQLPVPLSAVTQAPPGPPTETTTPPTQTKPRPERARRLFIKAALATATATIVAATAVTIYYLGERPNLIYDDGFDGRHWWPVDKSTNPPAQATLSDGFYTLSVTGQGNGIPAAADVDTSRYKDVTVTAKATGVGAYGVWCRGTPANKPAAKYEFYVTSTGESGITKRLPNGQAFELLPFHTTFTPIANKPNTIKARCQTVPTGVSLTLTVNEGTPTTIIDTQTPLNQGAVGLITAAKSTPTAKATYDTLKIETP